MKKEPATIRFAHSVHYHKCYCFCLSIFTVVVEGCEMKKNVDVIVTYTSLDLMFLFVFSVMSLAYIHCADFGLFIILNTRCTDTNCERNKEVDIDKCQKLKKKKTEKKMSTLLQIGVDEIIERNGKWEKLKTYWIRRLNRIEKWSFYYIEIDHQILETVRQDTFSILEYLLFIIAALKHLSYSFNSKGIHSLTWVVLILSNIYFQCDKFFNVAMIK